MNIYDTREGARLRLNQEGKGHWNRWGPFLAERAWGTVREDYSADGNAWAYFPHDHARARAYRWNEDGLAGICDRHQYLCFALALWNGRDPFLKERLFGLAGPEGNHGEDVKEYYWYLDSTPTHSYMKCLYRYPHAAFPYARLLDENRRRSRLEPEFELIDTGIFDEGRYFDVQVEYAKLAAEDLLIHIRVTNHGPEAARLELLPTLWFRNTWIWGRDPRRPSLARLNATDIVATHWELGKYVWHCPGADELLFTENETNTALFGVAPAQPYVKDAFHGYVVHGQRGAVNPAAVGTKAAARYARTIAAGQSLEVELRLFVVPPSGGESPADRLKAELPTSLFQQRRDEADEFYNVVLSSDLSPDSRLVARQAFAGMLWSKQYYHYVITDWLEGDPTEPVPPPQRRQGRNHEWTHFFVRDVISMPDKWEFPWFASWDLGFHCITLAHVDPQFAKDQITLMLREWYMHPNGQVPAYEWDFGDVNPPVLAIAARRVFEIDRQITGTGDFHFLESVLHKLMLNFTWWVNRKDALGNDIFQGGFLGMDNIGPFDRGKLPPGWLLGQADGTGWMAAFARSLMAMALELAEGDSVYQGLASKFWEHYVYIANAMNSRHDPGQSLWDEDDGFFYDQLISPRGERIPVRARTMVGFVPLFGAKAIPADAFERHPHFRHRRAWFITHRPELIHTVEPMVVPGPTRHVITGLPRRDQLARMLKYMLDEDEFLSPHGVRAVSRYHRDHPLVLDLDGHEYRLDYEPGESTTDLFGGNSNWRGPVWLPVNFLIILALEQYQEYFGDTFKVECPTGSGQWMNLGQVALEIAARVARLFLRDPAGRRAVLGAYGHLADDPKWRDLVSFYEYYHGDNGRGCGASHQTGWSGLIAQVLLRWSR